MTDTILPSMDLTGMPPALEPPEPGQPIPTDPDEIAVYARRCYLEARGHELWTRYDLMAEESEGFYIGGELQWPEEDRARLKQGKRAMVSINHCRPIIKTMTGFERQNRTDIKATPQGDEDAEAAQLMTWLLKFVQERTSCADHLTEAFESGVIRGMDCLEVGVDYTEDPISGAIYIARLKPGIDRDIIWDPYCLDYDLSDAVNGARYVIKTKWAFVRDLIARHPSKHQQIETAAASLSLIFAHVGEGMSVQGPPSDGYGSVRNHPVERPETERLFYDASDQRMLVMEFWYRDWQPRYLVVDKKTGDVHEVDAWADAQAMAKTDAKHLRAVQRQVRTVKMTTILPAGYVVLEEPTEPYDNDAAAYPFVPFIAERKGDYIYGVIESLKDPQRVENRRVSQVLDILGKFANLRPLVPKGTLGASNPFENPGDTSPIIYDTEKGAPSWFVPPLGELARVLTEVAGMMKLNIREVSGVNAPLQGIQESADQSGIALARLQSQGQVIATSYFDNLRRTRKLVGQRIAKRIQQVFTMEQIVRLTTDVGANLLVRLNPVEFQDRPAPSPEEWTEFRAEQKRLGKPDVLRDIASLKFDVIISEAPATPSARATSLLALLDIVEKLPMLAPAMIDVIVELADIPDRQRILDRVKKLIPPELGGAGLPPSGLGPEMGPTPTPPGPAAPPMPPMAMAA